MNASQLRARLFVLLLSVLPHQGLSRLLGALVEWRLSAWKRLLIRLFCRVYGVNQEEAPPPDAAAYRCFGDYFARPIDLSLRPVPSEPDHLVSPADGALSQFGAIESGRLIQAKGKWFTVAELLDDAETAQHYERGSFCTIYLSPRDYHRVHMPLTGKLERLVHLPGRLFSVQDATARTVPRLYARNERAVFHFSSSQGPFVVVMVGAIFVSGIATAWGGIINPHGRRGQRWEQRFDDADQTIAHRAGDELGAFRMGSTAIVLLPRDVAWAPALSPGCAVRVRSSLGRLGA